MGSILSGYDGKFNDFELARAWGVSSIMIILSPVLLCVIHRFWLTRNNYEMEIRDAKAVIMAPWFILFRNIFEAMCHFTLNLDLAKEDWEDFEIFRHKRWNMTSIFNHLAIASLLLCGAAYFYRVWMFWFRNKVQDGAKALFEKSETSIAPGSLRVGFGRRDTIGHPWKVSGVLFIWFLMTIIPYSYINENTFKNLWISAMGFTMLILSILLLRRVKSKSSLGILREYKFMLLTLILLYGGNLLMYFIPFFRDTYYDLLIDFLWRAVIFDIYFIWLSRFMTTYDVTIIEQENQKFSRIKSRKRKRKKKKKKTAKGVRASTDSDQKELGVELAVAKTNSRESDIMSMPEFDGNLSSPGSVWSVSCIEDLSLTEVLSNQENFNQFRKHACETLCSENLLFFVDVYLHRRDLHEDPFLEKIAGETTVIKDCAKLEMVWIDQEEQVPTLREIYLNYIKTHSQYEVNIPGRMRKKIMSFFGDGRKTKRLKRNVQNSLVNEMGNANSIRSEEKPSNRDWNVPKIDSINRPSSLKVKDPNCGANPADLSLYNAHAVSNRSVVKSNLQLTNHSSLGASNAYENMTYPSIEVLYPAWKTLVNLLKSDTLVRFKRRNIEVLESY